MSNCNISPQICLCHVSEGFAHWDQRYCIECGCSLDGIRLKPEKLTKVNELEQRIAKLEEGLTKFVNLCRDDDKVVCELEQRIVKLEELVDIEKIEKLIWNGFETHASILNCEAKFKKLEEQVKALQQNPEKECNHNIVGCFDKGGELPPFRYCTECRKTFEWQQNPAVDESEDLPKVDSSQFASVAHLMNLAKSYDECQCKCHNIKGNWSEHLQCIDCADGCNKKKKTKTYWVNVYKNGEDLKVGFEKLGSTLQMVMNGWEVIKRISFEVDE